MTHLPGTPDPTASRAYLQLSGPGRVEAVGVDVRLDGPGDLVGDRPPVAAESADLVRGQADRRDRHPADRPGPGREPGSGRLEARAVGDDQGRHPEDLLGLP